MIDTGPALTLSGSIGRATFGVVSALTTPLDATVATTAPATDTILVAIFRIDGLFKIFLNTSVLSYFLLK